MSTSVGLSVEIKEQTLYATTATLMPSVSIPLALSNVSVNRAGKEMVESVMITTSV